MQHSIFKHIALLIGAIFLTTPISHSAFAGSQPPSDMTKHSLLVNGVERDYIVYSRPGDKMKRPVVFAFHGGFGTAESIEGQSKLHETPQGQNYVIVYPNGYRRSWNVGPCCGKAKKEGLDELAFFDAMLEDIQTVTKIDTSRVYVTGFSNGAMMTYYLACNRANKIAAIAPVGGAMQGALQSCHPSRPVPLMHLHGVADEWAPFLGGIGKRKKAGQQRSIPDLIKFFRDNYDCTGKENYSFSKDVNCTRPSQCASESTVILCTIQGLGHQWPGHRPRYMMQKMLGSAKPGVRGSEEILKFFSRWSL